MKRRWHFDFVRCGLLSLCALAILDGCSDMVLFHPRGPIGDVNRFTIVIAILLMLVILIPVFILTVLFPRRYNASNPKGPYRPNWAHSPKIELAMWLIPIAIVMGLMYICFTRTYELDPYKPIHSYAKPIRVQVVSLDWKYLFIYPEQNIATVNELVFPANVPLSFELTSATVMTSFFIPQLGSQIYAMGGMRTLLHLMADQPGTYLGQNQLFSGNGYADMYFNAIATSGEGFDAWVQKVNQSPERLDLARYEALTKPTVGYPVTYFSSVRPDLFDHIIRIYNPRWGRTGAPVAK